MYMYVPFDISFLGNNLMISSDPNCCEKYVRNKFKLSECGINIIQYYDFAAINV